MISVVVYGRNDDYGYNLHKRAALSLNSIAEVLTDEEDEIIFVDYNTDDELPTFPEAIHDTLTPHARALVRVLRVRPSVHDRLFARRTHLRAVEPVARNVAVRRSNPQNRWILSTNTDMVFITLDGRSLSDHVRDLEDGYYCAPRIEVPEFVWETFDRVAPTATMGELRQLRKDLHLDEIVYGSDLILYDAPGDFQLVLRDDLFAVGGFSEAMLKGWHVDSNLSARLKILRGVVGDAGQFVAGYHFDHTRQMTPMHAPNAVENDAFEFVDSVTSPEIMWPGYEWGLATESVEEIRLSPRTGMSRAVSVAADVIGGPQQSAYSSAYRVSTCEAAPAVPEHVLPHLMNLLVTLPRDTPAVWIGPDDGLERRVRSVWEGLGFMQGIAGLESLRDREQNPIVMVNFGLPFPVFAGEASEVVEGFYAVALEAIRRRDSGLRPLRVIAINSINNRYEQLMTQYFACARTPFSLRLRIGTIRSDAEPPPFTDARHAQDWTGLVVPGPVGRRVHGRIASVAGRGHVLYGPNQHLPSGSYEAAVDLDLRLLHRPGRPRAYVDVAVDGQPLAAVAIPIGGAFGRRSVRLPFAIGTASARRPTEIRLHSNGRPRIRVRSVTVRRTDLDG